MIQREYLANHLPTRRSRGRLASGVLTLVLAAGAGAALPGTEVRGQSAGAVLPRLGETQNLSKQPNVFQRMGQGISSAFGRLTGRKKDQIAPSPNNLDRNDPLSLWHDDPSPDANLFTKLAEMQEQAGNLRGAEEQYQKALSQRGNHVPALLGLARLQDRQGKTEEAVTYYRRAIEADPRDPTPHNDLALCLARSGDLETAATEMAAAVELDGTQPLYRNNLATILVDLGRYPDALEQLVQAHGGAVGNYNLGYLLAERGQTGPARYHFSEAMRLDPQLAEARQWVELLSQPGSGAPAQAYADVTSLEPEVPGYPQAIAQPAPRAPLAGGPAGMGQADGPEAPTPGNFRGAAPPALGPGTAGRATRPPARY